MPRMTPLPKIGTARLAYETGHGSGTEADRGLARANSLTIRDCCKTYGAVTAVRDMSIDVAPGEFLTLLGPSGSGKTTLLMMIAGFVEPTAGDIFVNSRRITLLPPEKRNFGMVFQGYALFPHMTVAQNIAYPLKIRGTPKAEIAHKVNEALDLVRLRGMADRLPRQLSGGQQQRVAIARALVFSPDILLFDEPLGALDRKLRGEVQLELKRLHAELGATFIYVTHDQDEAMTMSDRVAIIDGGRLVQIGAPSELYERPNSRFAAAFLGRSAFIDGRLVARHGEEAEIAVGEARVRHRGPVPPLADGAVTLSLRPEKVRIGTEPPERGLNRARGTIESVAYLGATMEIAVATAEFGQLLVTAFSAQLGTEPATGTPVWLSWAPEATVCLPGETAA